MVYDMRLSEFVEDTMPACQKPHSRIPRPSEAYKATVVLAAAAVLFWIVFGGMALGGLLAAWVAR